MEIVNLDLRQLLGFRLASPAATDAKVGDKGYDNGVLKDPGQTVR
ncbi:hypothetical protein [Histidinibacterium lentulum]|nr:hypothetical protein [Histidinibacterium lentulum]